MSPPSSVRQFLYVKKLSRGFVMPFMTRAYKAGDWLCRESRIYRKVSNIRRTLVGNKIVDHSDVVGASPELHLHSQLNTWLQWIGQRQLQDETRSIYVWGLGASYIIRDLTVLWICCRARSICSDLELANRNVTKAITLKLPQGFARTLWPIWMMSPGLKCELKSSVAVKSEYISSYRQYCTCWWFSTAGN